MCKIRLDEVCELRVYVQRSGDLGYPGDIAVSPLEPETAFRLATRRPRVERGRPAVGCEQALGRRGAVVRGEHGGARVAEGVERVEVELGEAVRSLRFRGGGRVRCLVLRLRGAHVDGRGAGAGVCAARVVRTDRKGLEFWVGSLSVVEGLGAVGADAAGGYVAGFVAKDEAGYDVEDADDERQDA